MQKRFSTLILFLSVFMLSGCVPQQQGEKVLQMQDLKGGVIFSEDRGTTYAPRAMAEENKSMAGVQVLWLAMDQTNSQHMYLGSLENGIFVTEDGGVVWKHLEVPFIKVYGIEIHPTDPNIVYAAGVDDGRGQIFKSTDGGQNWMSIYNEPADGTVVIALDMSRHSPNILYAGTSGGTIIKTEDEGQTWENMYFAGQPVREVAVDPFDPASVYAYISEDTLLLSRDYGRDFEDMKSRADDKQDELEERCREQEEGEECSVEWPDIGSIYSFTLDLNTPGFGYVGTDDGLLAFREYGDAWEEVNIIASSREFPIRTVSVNPYRSQEIFYSSARAIYRSLDGGTNWYTYELEAEATPSIILHDWAGPDRLFIGLREARDSGGGLFGR